MKLNLDDWQKEILNTKGNIILAAGRQTGKSTIISIRDGERAVKNPKESILIIAPTERQSEEIFNKILLYISDNYKKMIKKGKDRPTKHVIRLTNGSIIRCLPTGLAGIGIRGFTITKLTAEEAPYINEEVWHAVTPMLLTTGGDMDLLGTPHGRQGYFYECFKNVDNRFKVFHVNSEQVMMNRAISDTWTQWKREKAIEHLEREKKSMTKNQYLQEYCGEFVEDLRQFFSDELITKCMLLKRQNGIQKEKTFFLGIDVARMGEDECTFEILDRTNRDKLYHVENIIFKKVYLNEVYNKVLELDNLYNFKSIYIDTGGIGIGVFDFLLEHKQTKRKIVPINNREMSLSQDDKHHKKILKEDLYNNLLGLMERGQILLLDDDEIFQSLKSVQWDYNVAPNSITKLRIFGTYTHIAEGLIRAAWCVKDKRLNIWVR